MIIFDHTVFYIFIYWCASGEICFHAKHLCQNVSV